MSYEQAKKAGVSVVYMRVKVQVSVSTTQDNPYTLFTELVMHFQCRAKCL